MSKTVAPSYPNHIFSHFKTVQAAKDYVNRNKKEYVWLNEFERKENIVSAKVLAISPPVLELMKRMGIAEVKEDIVGKQMFGWFNRFAEYMKDEKKGQDEAGGSAFQQVQQGMYGLTLQRKQTVPLSVSIRVEEPGSRIEYLTLVMSEEFVTEGEKDVILVKADIKKITEKKYKSLKDAKKTVEFILDKETVIGEPENLYKKDTQKPYDLRLPQMRREEKAIMIELLRQITALKDLGDIPKLLKNVPIPVHFTTKDDYDYVLVGCSDELLRFLGLKKEDIEGKPVWNFYSIAQNNLDISAEHLAKFFESQQKYRQMLDQGQRLPDTHIAARFKERTESYIIHFHRERIYSDEGQLLGDLTFMPFEVITRQHFLLLEQEDLLLVEEESTSLIVEILSPFIKKELEGTPQESNLDEEKPRNDQPDSKVLDMPKSNQTPEDAPSETLPTSPQKEKEWAEEIKSKREPKRSFLTATATLPMSQMENIIIPILEQVTQIKERAERELKTVLSPIRNIGTLYLLWKADPALRPIVSHQLKAICPSIPNNATAGFHIKTSKKIKYLAIQWYRDGKVKEGIHLGRLDEFEEALGLEPNATLEKNWVESTKLKDMAQRVGYKKTSF